MRGWRRVLCYAAALALVLPCVLPAQSASAVGAEAYAPPGADALEAAQLEGTEAEQPEGMEAAQLEELVQPNALEAVQPETMETAQLEELAQPEDIVTSEDELSAWLQSHAETGGTVRLGATITISYSPGLYGTESITIETGAYGLIFDGGFLDSPALYLSGEGVNVPVLEVRSVGRLWQGNWVNYIQQLHITATGNQEGTGGTALLLTLEDTGWPGLSMDFRTRGAIEAHGAGAVGIELRQPGGAAVQPRLDPYCFEVTVSGEGSVAIKAAAGRSATVYYSRITATGGGVVSSGDVRFEGCLLSPAAGSSRAYKVLGLSLAYLPVQLDEVLELRALGFHNLMPCIIEASDGEVFVSALPVEWDTEAFLAIDTAMLETTEIAGALRPPFDDLDITIEEPLTLTVEVRDPSLPCITAVALRSAVVDGEADRLSISLWSYPVSQWFEPEEIILWRSDNGGQTWYDDTDNELLEWYGSRFELSTAGLEGTVLYKIELKDSGFSNILEINSQSGIYTFGIGGDRSGADQGPQDPPDTEQPAPTPNPNPNPNPDGGDGGNPSDDSREDGASGRTDSQVYVPAQQTPLASDETELMMEYSTTNSLSISGLRLKTMLALAGSTVLFEKQGVSVELSTDFLTELELDDSSRFEVRIDKSEDGFTLAITVDSVPLFSLPPTTVYVPFVLTGEMNSENLACFNAQKQEVSTAVYDPARQVVRVEIPSTGSYTIAERDAAAAPVSTQEASAPVEGGTAEGAARAGGVLGSWVIVGALGLVAVVLCVGILLLRSRGRMVGNNS